MDLILSQLNPFHTRSFLYHSPNVSTSNSFEILYGKVFKQHTSIFPPYQLCCSVVVAT